MAFTTARKLRFGYCDLSGIAYFPDYMHIMVGVMEEVFESIGAPWPDLLGKRRVGLPTLHLDVTFISPGFHGDVLDFAVTMEEIGRSSVRLRYDVTVTGRAVWTCRQKLVCTSLDTHKSIPWPDDLREGLARYKDIDDA